MYSFARTKEYQKSARYFRSAGGTNQGLLAPGDPKAVGLNTKNPSRCARGFFVFRRFEVAARRNVRAAACFYADANAPAGSQRQHMPFTVTTLSGENANRKNPRLRSNESPSGAFKRQSGLRKQMEGLCPDKLRRFFRFTKLKFYFRYLCPEQRGGHFRS